MATKWVYTRVEMDCCKVQNCMQSIYQDELCRHHWCKREQLPKRIEVSIGDREWYAEQGRTLDESALLARRQPIEGPMSWQA